MQLAENTKYGCGPPPGAGLFGPYVLYGKFVSDVLRGRMWTDGEYGYDRSVRTVRWAIEFLTGTQGGWIDDVNKTKGKMDHFPGAFFALVQMGKAKRGERTEMWNPIDRDPTDLTPAQLILKDYLGTMQKLEKQLLAKQAVRIPKKKLEELAVFFDHVHDFRNEDYLKDPLEILLQDAIRDDH